MTALHYAVQGNRELILLLIGSGADIPIRDRQFNATPFGWARYQGYEEIVQLLKARCDLDPADLET